MWDTSESSALFIKQWHWAVSTMCFIHDYEYTIGLWQSKHKSTILRLLGSEVLADSNVESSRRGILIYWHMLRIWLKCRCVNKELVTPCWETGPKVLAFCCQGGGTVEIVTAPWHTEASWPNLSRTWHWTTSQTPLPQNLPILPPLPQKTLSKRTTKIGLKLRLSGLSV